MVRVVRLTTTTARTEPLLLSLGAEYVKEEEKHDHHDYQQQHDDQQHRHLSGDNDDDGGYLVDSDGNAYQPYSLSWRYLGVFLDSCDDDNNNRHRRRRLEDGNYYHSCRKVLWAAYHDPGYQGNGIAEYQFYDKENGSWDGSTCRAQTYGLYWPWTRCQRLDCHQKGTHLQLVGVFKETDGLYDFTEQLFKHQGYCLWDEDKNNDSGDSGDSNSDDDDDDDEYSSYSDYNFMTNLAEDWVSGCTQHDSAVDPTTGNAIYYDTRPLPGGDITYGVYTDANCLTESTTLTWSDVLASDNDNDDGMPSVASLDRWNTLLSDYKICQPCRAYNRVKTGQGGSSDSGSGSEDSGDYEDGDDGEGGKDRWGFNCYDDAGYLNCNQCYKFQTQTNMEPASSDDLQRATEQGTILAIQLADGTAYGKGHFAASGRALRVVKKTALVSTLALAGSGLAYLYYWKKQKQNRRVDNAELNGRLNEKEDGIFSVGATAAAAPLHEKLRSFFFPSNPPIVVGEIINPTTAMPMTTTTAAAAGDDDDDREKNMLVAQLRERDAKLSQQEQLIQQLQQKLDYYESTRTTTGNTDAQQTHKLDSSQSNNTNTGVQQKLDSYVINNTNAGAQQKLDTHHRKIV